MATIVGLWRMTQSFEMTPFNVEFFPDGTLNIDDVFFGTWTLSPDNGQIGMAIGQGGKTITSYWGTVIDTHAREPFGVAMSGLATGAQVPALSSGKPGYWVAIRLQLEN